MSGRRAGDVKGKYGPKGREVGQFIDKYVNWVAENPVLLPGHIGIESDTGRVKWGDGQTPWNQLPYRIEPPEDGYQFERSGKDVNGIFTVVTHKRPDNSIFKTSTLTGGTSPEYSLRTVRYFAEDGETVLSTTYYALTYQDGELISEVFD